jgi:hypothetical protein
MFIDKCPERELVPNQMPMITESQVSLTTMFTNSSFIYYGAHRLLISHSPDKGLSVHVQGVNVHVIKSFSTNV